MGHTILLVDDEPKILRGLTRVLQTEPYHILTAADTEEAAVILERQNVDLIVSDEEMPGMSGTEFLARVADRYPDVVRIVLTGHPSLPAALRAINEGRVYQFFTKPCNEVDLAVTIRRALEQKDLMARSRDLLEMTKRQSVLIDEARIRRRLEGLPRRERAEVMAGGLRPMDQRELIAEIDHELRRGNELLGAAQTGQISRQQAGPGQDARDEQEQGVQAGEEAAVHACARRVADCDPSGDRHADAEAPFRE